MKLLIEVKQFYKYLVSSGKEIQDAIFDFSICTFCTYVQYVHFNIVNYFNSQCYYVRGKIVDLFIHNIFFLELEKNCVPNCTCRISVLLTKELLTSNVIVFIYELLNLFSN